MGNHWECWRYALGSPQSTWSFAPRESLLRSIPIVQGGFVANWQTTGGGARPIEEWGQCLQSKPQCLHSGYMKPIITRVSPFVGAEKGKRR
jgi:hypothetical protein